MEITIQIKDSHGKIIEVKHEVADIAGVSIINEVESLMGVISTSMLPTLSSEIVEESQAVFEEKKNKEEEW
jgi:hypothetical protein